MRKPDAFSIISSYQQSIPVDVRSLTKDLGILLINVDWDDEISGAIEQQKSGIYLISVNANHLEVRQRFTIAHELGHYFLHRDEIDQGGLADNRLYRTVNFRNYQNRLIGPSQETQANRFAANLLMPLRIVQKLKNEGLSLIDMAAKLKVSIGAMKIRYDSC